MKYLLDTNVISELISKQANLDVLKFVQNLDDSQLFLSVVTIGELKSGIERLDDGSKKQKLLKWFENDLLQKYANNIVNINTNIMLKWGEMNQNLKQKGKQLPIMDSLIGATCIEKDFTLVTRNEKDFQNLNIVIINPWLVS